MSLPPNEQRDEPVTAAHRTAGRAALVAVALLAIGALGAACGAASSDPGVASVGKTTTTTGPSIRQSGSSASLENSALAYVACMRTHGEPNMPEPSFSSGNAHVSINASSGVDPSSSQFTAANNACKHLLPKGGAGASSASTITPADQAEYLEAAACMRSHGISNFPDPTFQNNSVEFNTPAPIDTNTSQYKSALATCQKLIPAGLPYSSTSGS